MRRSKMVSIYNVSKIIRKRTIVDNVNFDVYDGEIVGLLGPNGAGKTTLLKMILGLTTITRGTIQINNKDISTQFEEAIRNVGAIVETPRFYKYLNGYKNLILHANLNEKVSNDELQRIIKLVGLENSIMNKVKQYSLGMNQRLGIAVALLNNPSLLILDEPTNGLDATGVQELRMLLKRLVSDRSVSIIISSHALSEMELICDRVVFINQGKILKIEEVKELLQHDEINYQIQLKDAGNMLNALNVIKEKGRPVLFQEKNTLIAKLNTGQVSEVLIEYAALGIEIIAVIPMKETLEEKYVNIIRS